MGKLIPIILILAGVGGGIGAGLALRPSDTGEMAADDHGAAETADEGHAAEPDSHAAPADDHAAPADDHGSAADADGGHGEEVVADVEYFALQRQLIVPLVDGDRVGALIVMSLSIEATGGNIETIYDREPKLRDEFLQVLFRHANTGGFDGVFTSGEAMSDLKSALNAAARSVLGAISREVLVTEILRQEI